MPRVINVQYQQYLDSPAWRQKRQERLEQDGHQCFRCRSAEQLEVHHITYERLGRERLTDLLTLCKRCHARDHGRDPDLPECAPDAFYQERALRAMTFERWQGVVADVVQASRLLDRVFYVSWREADVRAQQIRGSLNSLMRELAGEYDQEWQPRYEKEAA